jgi:hypothetical protein
MTLIVYKKRILVSDTRVTAHFDDKGDYVCGHCYKPSCNVRDNSHKISLFKSSNVVKFRDQVVLATGTAGETKKSAIVIQLLRAGQDVEQAYANYRAFHNNAEAPTSARVLLVCEKNVFVLGLPRRGNMEVKSYELDDFVAIGSGEDGAIWINHLMPDADASRIVNLIMAKDESVGGEILIIDFNEKELRRQAATPKDPLKLLETMNKVFEVGEATILEEAKKAKAKNSEKPSTKAVDAPAAPPAKAATKPPAKRIMTRNKLAVKSVAKPPRAVRGLKRS